MSFEVEPRSNVKMRNLRLDSLPSDRPTATRDCRVCTKRRIKCDRSLPSCQKCSSRALSCPGYSLLLRWDQGVASRGKLRGRKLPLPSPSRSNDPPIRGTTGSPGGSPWETSNPAADVVRDVIQTPHLETNAQLFNRYSSQALREMLLCHFHDEVAPLLAWLDGPKNPWRSLVLPLAQRSTCLHVSILGLAAAHIWVTSADDEAAPVVHHFRDISLRDLNAKLNSELGRSPVPDPSSLIEITTTIVSLCYAEMLIPNSVDWKLHLRGCRASLDRYSSQTHQQSPQRLISQFLLEEVVYLEAFGTISSFTVNPGREHPALSPSSFDDHFWGFTELLCTITMVERNRFHAKEQGHEPEDVDMDGWKAKLRQVYNSACAGIISGSSQDVVMQACLDAVMRAQYYACMIYNYQAIASWSKAEEAIPSLVDSLFDEIMFITTWPVPAVSLYVSFPLFIAGTECRANKERQCTIHDLFVKSISATGFSCNTAVIQFLIAYWAASESHAVGRWIQYARENEHQMIPFIVF
ncbi:hypothetical protein FALCPG4_011538 [Fusarium falciforme]